MERRGRGVVSAWRPTAALFIGVILLAGCGQQPSGSGPSGVAESARVRHDEEPVRARFPELGDPQRVVWTASPLGEADPRVPGPTDVRISGVAWLSAAEAESLRSARVWRRAEADPDVLDGLSSYVPDDASWQATEVYGASAEASGTFHADFDRRVVVFDAVNPPTYDTGSS